MYHVTVIEIATGERLNLPKRKARALVEAGTHQYANVYRDRMMRHR